MRGVAAARSVQARWSDGHFTWGRPGRKSRFAFQRDAVLTAVGTRFALTNVSTLIGMRDGAQVRLPSCMLGREPVRWDLWWPHLGIAVDLRAVDEAEQDAKVEWANEHGILYCSPSVNATDDGAIDLVLLGQAAATRRAPT